jgi:hypothetical protein
LILRNNKVNVARGMKKLLVSVKLGRKQADANKHTQELESAVHPGAAASIWCGVRGSLSLIGETRVPVLIRVILPGGWWWDFRDRGKPLASGGHDIVDTLGIGSLLGVFIDFPFPPPTPSPG